jgi:hypothetical protein
VRMVFRNHSLLPSTGLASRLPANKAQSERTIDGELTPSLLARGKASEGTSMRKVFAGWRPGSSPAFESEK